MAEEAAFDKSFIKASNAKILQIEMLHKKAEALILENDLRGALKVYLDIILLEPDDETAYTNMGQAYMILGDTPHANDAFLNALHINSENETALLGLEKIHDPDGALKPNRSVEPYETRAEGGS